MKKKKRIKATLRTLWTHQFINKVIPDKRRKVKHKKIVIGED